MDITLTWALPINQLPTDEYDVLYKVWDANGLNNWVLANTTPLPPTTTTYTITGLNPNTIYRVAVTKSCVGGGSYVDEATYVDIVCPIISFWQGPVVNSEQTLFYSVNYPDATHVTNTEILVYDTTFDDRFLNDCGTGPTAIPIGRTSYQIADGCATPNIVTCVKQLLDFKVPNTGASGVGYYGLDTIVGFNPFLCDGSTTNPILFREGNTYKFELNTIIDTVSLGVTIDFSTVDTTCKLAPSAPVYTFTSHPIPDTALLSSALCFDPLTGLVSFTTGDGTGTTDINDYTFLYGTSDGVSPGIPLLDNAGNLITSSNGSYNIYAPIKIQSSTVPAPGGGNPLGYTITGATYDGVSSTTYTYTGGTNAFTVGQDVFVNSINPASFEFATTSKTITAATPNSFTVAFSPAGTYQTGGTASGYAELTDGMTITVDLQPGQNVITLTNQNYSGLTLIQALTQIATAINNAGTYTASAVVIAGLPYLKIDVPNSTYTSASVIFQGPNILTKGGPDIPQISQPGYQTYATSSSVSYNNFLYASFYASTTAEIIASDTTLVDPPTSYGHDIDIPVWTMALVEQAPPTTVYSLDHITSGGNYSLNIATNSNTGYIYVADNTTVSVYNGKTLIDSQDLSLLSQGPTTPIRLMEYNTTDNYLYVFTDGSSANFRIVVNPSVGTWGVGHVGTYAQTNYLKRGTITAWNNITTGPTAAKGFITSVPTQPIPCSTMPCACSSGGPVGPPPCATGIPNWTAGYNDGLRSELFQDSTKNWLVGNSYDTGFFKVYNYDTQQLGIKTELIAGDPYKPLRGIVGDTIVVSAAIDSTLTLGNVTYSSFASLSGNSYGLFSTYLIVDYNENFASRSWENTARYLIESGRNGESNGFIQTPVINSTYVVPDYYLRSLNVNSNRRDKQINSGLGLDGTSKYLLYEIKDGGTCYNSNNNKVFVSLDGGVVQVISNSGSIVNIQLYKDFPGTTTQVLGSLQMVADPNSNLVYGIARDARSDVDDMNIYVFNEAAQVGIIAGSGLWNESICGQISMDSDFLYFTGKYTRNFYQYNVVTEVWSVKIVPSVYEKFDGYEYGPASPLSRLQGGIERIQGATYIGGGKFVVMNYLQQTFSTQLKYVYDVANLFVYDYSTNTIDQALVGTGISAYSGVASSYNLNYYGEFFGINDYNTDYCYGGLGIKVDSNGRIFWKKAVSDQIYMSESHTESGVAQIWGTGAAGECPASKLIRIWNIQSDGSLVQSKRTILDIYSQFSYIAYDSFNERVITIPLTASNVSAQFYVINPNNLVGSYGVNDNGTTSKYNFAGNIGGLAVSTFLSGKQTTVYAVSVTPTDITYSVRPAAIGAGFNGIFPHHYAVGEVVKISGIVSSPADELNFPNGNVGAATIISVTPTTFTIANIGSTSATYTSGGTVIDTVWASIYTASNFGSMAVDNKGSIIVTGTGTGGGITGYGNAGTTFVLKYESNDLFTQRENPKVYTTGITSSPCVATPDQLFRGLGTPSIGRAHGQLNNAFLLHVPTQNTYWVMGSKNPSCTISGITAVTYNPIAQTIRYDIPNSFTVGKVISISGITPTTFNLSRVPIIAADPTGFEISYTGASPGTYISDGSVSLSGNYVIKVLDDTTLSTITTIDLSFINSLLDVWAGNPDSYVGRFQYSEDTDEIYLYSNYPADPVYVFSTITNSLVRSSSFKRMLSPYPVSPPSSSNSIFTLENVNGVPYFSAYVAANSPTRFWFRLDLGNRTYQNDTHDYLNITSSDGLTTITDTYNLYSFTNLSDTFGQWKVNTDTTWASIPGGSNITVNANEIIEFTMFSTSNTLLSVENITTSTVYDVPSYNNLDTFPTYNTLNSMLVFVIKADSVNLSNGDVLEFTFDNPQNPSCPFINSVTINF